jgi:gliding motility-associated-like protein
MIKKSAQIFLKPLCIGFNYARQFFTDFETIAFVRNVIRSNVKFTSALFLASLLALTAFESQAQFNLSVSFSDGFVGDNSANNKSINATLLSARGWSLAQFTQNSTAAIFTAQGNDIIGNVVLRDFNGTIHTIPGFIKWRSPSGNSPNTLVFSPNVGYSQALAVSGGGTYTINSTKYIGLTFNGSSVPLISGEVDGNAATTGLLGALNNYLAASAKLSINDVTVNESAGTATFTVSLSASYTSPITVNYSTTDVSATNTDYTTTSGTLTFPANTSTAQTITVPILDDGTFESTETFRVVLSNSVNAAIADNTGIGTITDNDTPINPTVVAAGGLSTFTTCAGTASSTQSFDVSGSLLTSDIVITAPAGYEISLAANSGFQNSLTLTQVSGTVAATTIYVRLTSSASNGASGNISVASSGATTENLATGTAVVNALPTVTGTTGGSNNGVGTVNLSGTASAGATLDWYAAASGGSALASGLSYTTPSISTTTTYYVQARNTTTGCISAARTAVVATITIADSDGDGVTDAQEAIDGTDPNNGCSYNVANQILANTSVSWQNADCDGDGNPNGTDSAPLTFCVDGAGSVPANGTPAYEIFRMQDCDGDGILNGLECTTGLNCPDFDGDGIPNFQDTDSDNDGILDVTEKELDFDGDGRGNYLDLDSDNDGILDIRETAADLDRDGRLNFLDLDADGDGILDTFEGTANFRPFGDNNGDGVCDVNGVTSDTNFNGIPDNVERAFGGRPLEIPDTDKDGIPDFLDLESDGDGILDSIELRGDIDGDQYPNYRDGDSDGDGVSDAYEKFGDMDSDGKPNFLDLDSDGDGLSDQYEGLNLCFDCGFLDNNIDGYDDRAQLNSKYPAVDTDADLAPDFLDLDSDNDGIPDAVEAGNDPKVPADTDKDGTPDFRDIDSDNDGILDALEAGADPAVPVDTDRDGTPDFRDIDSDNDGIQDATEAGVDPKKPLDTDGDGIFDFREVDSDNDGISDNIEKGPTAVPVDTDKDGLPDYRDIDSDNDGISDNIEKGPTATPVDTDGDGLPDFRDLDSDNDGISDNIEKGPSATPLDTDGDGTADFRDLDSDNDGISDNTEKGPAANPVDTDGDGAPDYRDVDSDNDGISDNIEKGPTANPVDTDGDALPDYRDLDSDNDTIPDNIEKGPSATPVDSDRDGIADFRDLDSDNDGLIDKVEAGPDPKNPLDSDKDLTFDFRDTDADNDRILDKDEDNLNVSGLADCDRDGIPNRLDPDKCPNFIPQGISPNGDGKNDTFIIPGILSAQPNTVTIFNRWGNIVYEKDNYQNDWFGQTDRAFDLLASDGLLPDGTYYYVVDFKGKKSNIKSYIYVNRLEK